jgi:quercetin dioxygenase-like cupin family protein
MKSTFDEPKLQQFNVFGVTQLSPETFLDGVLGLDVVHILENSTSEIHRHNFSDNVVYILQGNGTVVLDGQEHPVHPGLRISIPRGVAHGFRTAESELLFVSAQIPPILDKKTGAFDREILSE